MPPTCDSTSRSTSADAWAALVAAGIICINGAAAHLMKPMDLVIIASWTRVEAAEADDYDAKRVFVDSANRIRD